MKLLEEKYTNLLEIAEELGNVPVSTIDDGDLEQLQSELKKVGYDSYIDSSTDFLVIEKAWSVQIKNARKYARITQNELSKKYGIPLRTIKDWERGVRTPSDWVCKLLIERIESDY